MAKHTITRFYRYNSPLLTDEYRADDATPSLLAYVDHNGDGTASVTVSDPYTGNGRVYAARPTSKALGIVSRHVERMGYKYCLEVKDLTTGMDAAKL